MMDGFAVAVLLTRQTRLNSLIANSAEERVHMHSVQSKAQRAKSCACSSSTSSSVKTRQSGQGGS